jgi:hypothetical protein
MDHRPLNHDQACDLLPRTPVDSALQCVDQRDERRDAERVAADSIWLNLIVAVSPLLAGIGVLGGVIVTVRQRDTIDQREQWWKRVEWAAGLLTTSDERSRVLGVSALTSLIREMKPMDNGDAEFLRAIIDSVDLSRFAPPAEEDALPEGRTR